MRTIALLILTAAAANAASPIDSAIQTSQGVGTQGRLSAFARRGGPANGETVPELYPGENRDVGPQMFGQAAVAFVFLLSLLVGHAELSRHRRAVVGFHLTEPQEATAGANGRLCHRVE